MSVRIALAALAIAAPTSSVRSPSESRQYALTDAGTNEPGSAIGFAGLSETGFVTGSLSARGRHAPLGYRWSPAGSEPAFVLAPDRDSWTRSSAVGLHRSGTSVSSFRQGR